MYVIVTFCPPAVVMGYTVTFINWRSGAAKAKAGMASAPASTMAQIEAGFIKQGLLIVIPAPKIKTPDSPESYRLAPQKAIALFAWQGFD